MVTEGSTVVIDPEFAFYGPMGFDIGAVIANLLMAYLASAGHERSPGERRLFEVWMLETIENVWTEFSNEFLELWRRKGTAMPIPDAVSGCGRCGAPRGRTAGLYGAAVRRHRGICGGKDHPPHSRTGPQCRFELIEDVRRRAVCEARSLRLARAMMVETASFPRIGAVTKAARKVRDWEPDFAE